jgi:collagen type VI alpha
MIVITDGQDTSDVAAAHQLSLTKNITTYALGVGSGVDQAQMAQLTGDPTKVYNVTDFSAVGAILNNICVNIGTYITCCKSQILTDYYLRIFNCIAINNSSCY